VSLHLKTYMGIYLSFVLVGGLSLSALSCKASKPSRSRLILRNRSISNMGFLYLDLEMMELMPLRAKIKSSLFLLLSFMGSSDMENLNSDAVAALYLFVKQYFAEAMTGNLPINKMPPHFSLYSTTNKDEDTLSLKIEKPTLLDSLETDYWGSWANMALDKMPRADGGVFWGVVDLPIQTDTPNPHALVVVYQRGEPIVCLYTTLDFNHNPKMIPASKLFPEHSFDPFVVPLETH